ncbi:glycosyl hydrolase [Sphingobacterium humi]|uniref:Glycoside hydrolase family 2 n=1 Tax=Sphingobacterium humi TaxID=1796905 RepID=A0A6N8KXT8_9SPHI|nr:glycosyl hydrolase [Sphingobacterium humi]MVZ62290.1 glycoside hydrolase family 2 [Sphingobacterium humi]
MNRRSFLRQSSLIGAGFALANLNQAWASGFLPKEQSWYAMFQNPSAQYRPFVRWWWNGDKVEATELSRQLRLLKEAGIGGVEINPISFPKRADDMGIPSVKWLSNEWIDLVKHAASDAKSLDMTADLIVGSGWPFGSEELKEDERAQVVLVYAETLEGPLQFETSQFNICQAVDPGVTDKNPLRKPEILSLHLAKDPMHSLAEATDLSAKRKDELIHVDVPAGKHVLYAVVKFNSFAQVINGAPGASGSILNHMDKQAVQNYLNRMSNTMQNRIGALSQFIRSLFSDSMELEGCNWTHDFAQEFQKRCGYDLMPYLPFIMFKVGRLGAVVDENYGAAKSPEFKEQLNRVRFDFEFVKASLLRERFTETYLAWCKGLNVKSRAQAYGRGFFPLETSLGYDIPEGESWTTNYLRHKLGEEMGDEDYRRGRGYTMINKYVSSAAHLTGKRLVSCEEMTNTYLVFNATLELLKLGSDQSALSGITHSIWHGFNYSPKEAPFPGWIQYGSYYSEKNNWWPYFNYLNTYKARLSSQLQHADMYTDIAILPANYDLWAEKGVQTDPFPERLNVPYTSLLWEAIHKTGGGADYITELILKDAKVQNGKITYGKKAYGVLFLPGVQSMDVANMKKLYDFVQQGGKLICIEHMPSKSLGFKDMKQRDAEVVSWMDKIKTIANNFSFVEKPVDNKFLEWYIEFQQQKQLPKSLSISNPNRFFMQNRYVRDDKSEFYFFQNAHRFQAFPTQITFQEKLVKGKQAWVWDIDTGERFKLKLDKDHAFQHDFGPTESLLVVFDSEKKGDWYQAPKTSGKNTQDLSNNWQLELRHQQEGTVKSRQLAKLIDMKLDDELRDFSGTVVYKKTIDVADVKGATLNLGQVFGITDVLVNQQPVGVKWFGRRIYDLSSFLKPGKNELEIRLTTTMGNYLKTLKENENAQYWVNRPGREQEIQSMGIVGPVQLYN